MEIFTTMQKEHHFIYANVVVHSTKQQQNLRSSPELSPLCSVLTDNSGTERDFGSSRFRVSFVRDPEEAASRCSPTELLEEGPVFPEFPLNPAKKT